ncbi:MAG: hypothetical protein HKN32_04225 [Flavobacteriales bacterium]|nr:hypothetical protein [Flavobacteriales bacterium]
MLDVNDKKMKTLIFSLVAFPILVVAGEYPRDVVDVLSKLERFEAEELARANKAISDKRNEVADFLETALVRETKSGNLDTAVALKKKIEELRKSKPLSVSSGSKTAAQGKADIGFADWLETVEFHDDTGRWIVTGTEVIQHSNNGATKSFKRTKSDQDSKISFEASGTVFRFEIDADKSKGLRRSEKFAPIPFTVKPKKKR